jgi:hypothetical protein
MMRIFSYIFYTLSKPYRSGLDKRDPDVYARGVLTLLQGINISTILNPYIITITKDQKIIFYGITIIVLLIVNTIFFFNRKTLEKFDKRWDKEPKIQRYFRRFLVILYVIGTFVLFFAV